MMGGSFQGQRVRFADREEEKLRESVMEDMRRRDILADLTGNKGVEGK